MYEKQNYALLTRVMPLLVLALLASGCVHSMHGTNAKLLRTSTLYVVYGDVEVGGQTHTCPLRVVETVQSCPKSKAAPDTVCLSEGNKIDWDSVTGSGLPYDPGNGLKEFTLDFKGISSPVRGKNNGPCVTSIGGLLECKVMPGTKRVEPYKYDVSVDGCPTLDPRIYVD